MKTKIYFLALASGLFLASCTKGDGSIEPHPLTSNFTVQIENIGPVNEFLSSGVFNTPVGQTTPGAATPGKKYEFTVNAGRKQKLSFVTMLAATNDLFFAPKGTGIPLYDASGEPISGDVTNQVFLWDAGTEVNEEPAVGMNTVGKQAAPNTGVVENGNVLKIGDVTNGVHFNFPSVNEILKVTIKHNTGTEFTISIQDLETASLSTSEGAKAAPLSPGVWVIAGGDNILFTEGMPDRGQGIERIAEDGNPTELGTYAASTTGVTYPASPGVWIVHDKGTMPLFTNGKPDYKKGIENIAEDGNNSNLEMALTSLQGYIKGEGFNTPVGASAPGAIKPGAMYAFSFSANKGDYLSFASMLAATNDVFFAPKDAGIALFNKGLPISGDITDQVYFWDAGTEVNEQPAIGLNTVTNQLSPNTGVSESMPVQLLNKVNDGFAYPALNSVYKITITANQ